MAKNYYIDCKEVGFLDCEFSTQAETLEKVVEQCAEHGRLHHGLKGFGHELYAQMRPHIRTRDAEDEVSSRDSV